MNEFEREKALIRYLAALDSGDFDTAVAVLKQADADVELENLILEYQEEWVDENIGDVDENTDEALVHNMLREQGVYDSSHPSITVGDVARGLMQHPGVTASLRPQAACIAEQLAAAQEPLPEQVNDNTIGALLKRLGVKTTSKMQTLFRYVAQHLQQSQRQSQMQWAATRKQDSAETKSTDDE